MGIYKACSIKDLFNKNILENILENIVDIKIDLISTNGLSGSKMYKLKLISNDDSINLYLKINNLKEDWVSKISNDKGRELEIFKKGIYEKVHEFIDDVYIAYYKDSDSYAILMNDKSEYITEDENEENWHIYIDNLAKFHAKFKEQDVFLNKELLDTEQYYTFLTKTKVNMNEELSEGNEAGWEIVKELLGEELFNKYNNMSNIDEYFGHYPKTFLHGDYRPANTLYLENDEIRMIDWANSGYGPVTLDLFWYMITSLSPKIDKTEVIDYYRVSLEKYLGYKYTQKTWETLLKVGMLCACKMFLSALIAHSDLENKTDEENVNWWVNGVKDILK